MIDIDVARRLRDRGLEWTPQDGDRFVIDTEELLGDVFMLSSMVVERGLGRAGEHLFRFNGTTEWALDAVEESEVVWIPREDQLREALGRAFRSVVRGGDGVHTVTLDLPGGPREVRAPAVEDAYAGALLVLLES